MNKQGNKATKQQQTKLFNQLCNINFLSLSFSLNPTSGLRVNIDLFFENDKLKISKTNVKAKHSILYDYFKSQL